jgi:glycosyltransferase involved in cell wall biosynthesis
MAAYRKADAVIAVSDFDRDVILAEDRNIRSIVVRILIKAHAQLPVRKSKELLFIGTFSWPPNLDGIKWFVAEIWPTIRREVPEATVTIIGSNPTEEARRLGDCPGITMLGYVPETLLYLQRAALSIAPLRYGGGMKGKVVEAMAVGLPVVTTSVGAQGLNAVNGKHLLQADSPQEFAQAAIRLLRDQGESAQIAAAGQTHIAALCAPEAAEEVLESYLAEIKNGDFGSSYLFRRARGATAYVASGVFRRIRRRFERSQAKTSIS